MEDKQPLYILPEHMSRSMGSNAQQNNILAAKLVSDIVKTTLGPKGMDKLLVDATGEITVTNDGVTILQEVEIDHPAAKMLVEIAKTQESEVGDGTTTAVLLAGTLLDKASELINKKIHPTTIVKGYTLAAEQAKAYLNELALPLNDRSILIQIASTAMTGKGAEGNKEKLSNLIVSAVEQISINNEFSIQDIKIQKQKGESIDSSELIKGIILDKERANKDMPSKIENAKILLLDLPLEIRNTENEAKISVSTPEQLEKFLNAEEKYLKDLTEKVISSGANVVFSQKGIDDVAQYYLAKAGVLAARRIPKSDMEKLSRATGAKVLSTLSDLNESSLGSAQSVQERTQGDDESLYIEGCPNPRSVTLLLRGSSDHVLDEIERAVKDGLGDVSSALKSGMVVPGGGAIEMALSRRLLSYARTLTGREQLAVEAFAQSLEVIPETLAENAGLDPIEIITSLKRQHEMGDSKAGLNLFTNKIEDTLAQGIIEPLKVKTQAISSASEVATMILRIDDVLISSSSSSARQPNPYAGLD